MAEWSLDLEKYCEKKKKDIRTVRKQVAWQIFDGIVKKTPVDTGRARGNWQVSVGKDTTTQLDREDKGQLGSPAKNGKTEMAKIQGAGDEETIYIVNNLPYITKLEYGGYSKKSKTGKTVDGYSKQAPQGMVYLTLLEVSKFIKDAVSKVRGK